MRNEFGRRKEQPHRCVCGCLNLWIFHERARHFTKSRSGTSGLFFSVATGCQENVRWGSLCVDKILPNSCWFVVKTSVACAVFYNVRTKTCWVETKNKKNAAYCCEAQKHGKYRHVELDHAWQRCRLLRFANSLCKAALLYASVLCVSAAKHLHVRHAVSSTGERLIYSLQTKVSQSFSSV